MMTNKNTRLEVAGVMSAAGDGEIVIGDLFDQATPAWLFGGWASGRCGVQVCGKSLKGLPLFWRQHERAAFKGFGSHG